MNLFSYIIPGIFFFLGCKSPSDKILDDFRKVNESLEKLNEAADSSLGNIGSVGFKKSTADSIDRILNEASAYFMRIHGELGQLDAEGEKLDAAQKLLIKTTKGDSLYNYLLAVYNLDIKYGADTAGMQRFIWLKEDNKDKWLEKYFKMVPTIAAQTIVSKFRNDCSVVRRSIVTRGIQEAKQKITTE